MRFSIHLFDKNRFTGLTKAAGLFIVVGCLLLTFIIPPFQKTDEVSHYYKTIAVASGNLMCHNTNGEQPFTYLPESYAQLPETVLAEFVNDSHANRFPINAFKTAWQIDTTTRSYRKETISCSLPTVLYMPAAAMLAIPVALRLPPLLVFYLGRLSFLLLGYAAIFGAYKLIPKQYQFLLLGYLVLPTVLIQLGSFNKEVLHLGAGALVFASYLKLRKQFSKQLLLLLIGSLYVVVLARPFYAPMFVLVPLVMPKKMKRYVIASVLASLTIALLYLPKISLFHSGNLNFQGVSAALQLEYLQTYPTTFLSVVWNSYTNHMPAYAKSLIGTYGSIHYYLDWYIYVFFGAWLFWLCLQYRDRLPELSRKEVVGISLALVATTLSAFVLFYLYATPVAFHYVIDVQGRYFINALPFAMVLIMSVLKKFPKQSLIALFGIALLLLVKNAFNRYYDYSAGYLPANPEQWLTIAQQPSLQYMEVAEPITQVASLDPSRKLRGVSVLIVNEKKRITQPLEVVLSDEQCQQEIGRKLIMNHIQKSTMTIDVPIKADRTTAVCVTIQPFGTVASNARPERLATEPGSNPQRPMIMPLYAY